MAEPPPVHSPTTSVCTGKNRWRLEKHKRVPLPLPKRELGSDRGGKFTGNLGENCMKRAGEGAGNRQG